MKVKRIRALIPAIILAIAGVGYIAHTGFGNLSALGWETISVLCPLGALGTMLASKTIVPRAVISLVLAAAAIILFARAFCGWVCPVPVVSKLRTAFTKQKKPAVEDSEAQAEAAAGDAQTQAAAPAAGDAAVQLAASDAALDAAEGTQAALSEKERALLRPPCTHRHKGCSPECRPSNSRHLVLGGALLSAAIFGFPVFCLVCPIGLSFAMLFVLINLFGTGDVTWSVIVIPAVLLAEVVFFRKWCSHICPVSSLMSLLGRLNRTFKPSIDDSRCIEARGGTCGRCGQVCEVGIDPRHPELGASWSECTKCRACVEACPGKAISMPLLPRKRMPVTIASPKGGQDRPE